MELKASLPGRLFWVFREITATNQKLQELWVQAETLICEAKQNIGVFKELEKYEDIAKNAVKGALDKPCSVKNSSIKRCNWWNRGYCREGPAKCSYYHPSDDCEQHLQEGRCFSQGCTMRHRRRCKYWGTTEGCFRKEQCQYLPDMILSVWHLIKKLN